MPSGTWATSLFSTHSNTDHVRKALTHVKICLSTDNSERRFNNSTEKLKSGIKLNNWTQLNWTEQNWNAVQPCSMRSTCCQNANPTATLSGPLAGAGAGLLYILTSSFRQETTNCQTKQLLSNLLHTKAGAESTSGWKQQRNTREREGEGEEEKGNTYSMAKNWAVSIFMGQARSNFNISINFWQFFCKLPATVRQTECERGREKKLKT